MKSKGITIWEQYLERFILGVAALFFVVFTTLQFMSEPNSVEGRGTLGKVSPGEVDDLLRSKADQIAQGLAPDARPPLPLDDHEPLLDEFRVQLLASISPGSRIAVNRPGGGPAQSFGPATQAEVVYLVPDIPAPQTVVAEQGFDALEETVVSQIPQLQEQERFSQLPYDITWMTVGALFPLKSVREEFRREGTEEFAAIPKGWYRGEQPEILDVLLERQELVDGQWVNQVLLDPLPGVQVSFRPQMAEDADKRARDEILSYLSEPGAQRAIVQPDFYALVNGSWVPPNPRQDVERRPDPELPPEERAKRQLERQISKLIAQRDQARDRLADLGGSADLPPVQPPIGGGGTGGRQPPGKRKPPGSGGMGGMGGGMPGRNRGGGDSIVEQNKKKEIEKLRGRIRNLDVKIGKHRVRLAALTGEDQPAPDQATAAGPVGILDGDDVVVWAHDITVEPGKTYRYRIRAEVYNPFFARTLDLMPSQHELARKITLQSQASEWSEPARAIPPLKVFVTKATGPGGDRKIGDLGMGQAHIEVYRFFYGRWWSESFPLEPGDRVGSVRDLRQAEPGAGPQSIDYGTDWYVLDIVADIDADREAVERGWGASVLLQSLDDPQTMMWCNPREVADDWEREQLKEAVEMADLGGDLADSG